MEAAFKGYFTDAIRYWEPRRLLYNAVLTIITGIYFAKGYPHSRTTLTIDTALFLFVMAVGANIVYCAAYLPDLFAQASGFRDEWRKYRWLLFVIGLILAAIFTRWWAIGMFFAESVVPTL